MHPEDAADEAGAEDCSCPQLGGHSVAEFQHFHAPLGQQTVLLLPQLGLSPALHATSTELAAEEDAGALEDCGAEDDAGALEDCGAEDDAGALDEAGALEEVGVLDDAGALEEAGLLEDLALEEAGLLEELFEDEATLEDFDDDLLEDLALEERAEEDGGHGEGSVQRNTFCV